MLIRYARPFATAVLAVPYRCNASRATAVSNGSEGVFAHGPQPITVLPSDQQVRVTGYLPASPRRYPGR